MTRFKHTNLTITALLALLLSACGEDQSVSEPIQQPQPTPVASINTTIDGKLTPPDGKILMFIGQDSDTIGDYISDVPEDNIEGVTLYSQLKSNDLNSTLKGIFTTANWQSGDVDFSKTLKQAPSAALAIGLAIDTCDQQNHPQNIANGEYDQTLAALVDYLVGLAPRKVLLRIGYEFDGPWNCYQPQSYKAAFRHIALALQAAQADNVATVWQSATWPDSYGNILYDNHAENHWQKWYPGDDVVDWVGLSVFYRDLSQWNYTPPNTPDAAQQSMLAFAKARQKPVMIAESAPQGYRINGLTQSPIQENLQSSVSAEHIWQNWYQPYFEFIYQNHDVIRAVAYINANWESQGMWHCQPGIAAGQPGCAQGNWGDSRIQGNSYIKQKWLTEINNSQLWQQSGRY